MPTRKVRRTMEIEPSMVQTPSNFPNSNVEKYLNELQGKTFFQKRGFDPLMILGKEIWPLVRYHQWECFWTILKDNTVAPIFQEFYASLRDHEFRNNEGHIWDTILVRGKEDKEAQESKEVGEEEDNDEDKEMDDDVD
ncbi:hypothetical protein Goshw_001132 [Gossypium schwendimanii]|uniref:Uncharacterized protein n=1 Tax=Gossypium schwendimanii TaxID=34291 RepID=A0A7J9LT15_GOSSC|nr:hypothetical protein [Gossypium schwendimanii]